MSKLALEVQSPEAERDAVAAWLVGKTGETVEERADGTLVAAASDEYQAGSLLRELHSTFGAEVAGTTRELPEVDWNLRWKDGLGARRIGRLTIAPSWVARPGPTTVIVDPETAFGTGEHGSTRGALLLLDRLIRPGDRVLDLGSGSGILAIAAVKLGGARAVGVDLDPEVETVARANAERNGVGDRVRFLTGDAAILTPLLGPAELLLSNILRTQNLALLPAIRLALAARGTAIFAGMEAPERELFLAALAAHGWKAIDDAMDESWWSVAARPA